MRKRFHYRGRGLLGQKLEGDMTASDTDEVVRRLHDAGYVVTAVSRAADRDRFARWLTQFVPPQERVVLLEAWAMYLESGLPIQTALLRLSTTTRNVGVAQTIQRIAESIDEGMTLSEALRKNRFLPPSWVNTVEIGEKQGDFAGPLRLLQRHEQRFRSIKQQLVSMLMMPVVLVLLVTVWFWLFVTRVIPVLIDFMSQLGTTVPLSKPIIIISQIFYSNALWIFLAMALGAIFFKMTNRSDEEMGFFQKWIPPSVPWVGPVVSSMQLIVLASGLRFQLESGVTLREAVRAMAQGIRNRALRRTLVRVYRKLLRGATVSEAFSSLSLIPPMWHALLAAGEESGKIPQVLEVLEREARADLLARGKRLTVAMRSFVVMAAGIMVATQASLFFALVYSGVETALPAITPETRVDITFLMPIQ